MVILAWTCVALVGCGSSPPAPDVSSPADVPPPREVVTCPQDNEAPLHRGDAVPRCVVVGASTGEVAGDWPEMPGDMMPVVYVAPGADGGTGTRDNPYHDIARALMEPSSPPATILLGRGTFVLSSTVRVTRSVTIRGMGANMGDRATTIQAPTASDEPAFEVGLATGGAPIAVSFAQLGVRGGAAREPGPDDTTPGLRIQGTATTVSLRDVSVERMGEGVLVQQATLFADGLTVRRAGRIGVALSDRGAAILRHVLIRDGAGEGVLADEAWLSLRTGLVANHRRDGIALLGGRRTTACTARASPECPGNGGRPLNAGCPTATVGDASIEQRCLASRGRPAIGPDSCGNPADDGGIDATTSCYGISTIDDFAVVGNGVTGLRAERHPPNEGASPHDREVALAQPGAVVRATHLVVNRTNLPPDASLAGGDGLYVGPAALVVVDPDITSDAELGRGSEFAANSRTGILVDGDPLCGDGGADRVRNVIGARGVLCLAGASVRLNLGPGAYIQQEAQAGQLAYSEFHSNVALGLGVTLNSSAPEMFCDHFLGTRMGPLGTTQGMRMLGDGLSISGGIVRTRIAGSRIEGNQRFGLVLRDNAVEVTNTRSNGNRNGNGLIGTASIPTGRELLMPTVQPLSTPIADRALPGVSLR